MFRLCPPNRLIFWFSFGLLLILPNKELLLLLFILHNNKLLLLFVLLLLKNKLLLLFILLNNYCYYLFVNQIMN